MVMKARYIQKYTYRYIQKFLQFSGAGSEGIGLVQEVEGCKIVFERKLPIHVFRHFCHRRYHLATVLCSVHGIVDRQMTVMPKLIILIS